MAFSKPPSPKRVYVKVTSDFDATGFMQPRTITWKDGRVFRIDSVKDFRPSSTIGCDLPGDCYTVVVRGKTRRLFFERSRHHFASHFGRWFVETLK